MNDHGRKQANEWSSIVHLIRVGVVAASGLLPSHAIAGVAEVVTNWENVAFRFMNHSSKRMFNKIPPGSKPSGDFDVGF